MPESVSTGRALVALLVVVVVGVLAVHPTLAQAIGADVWNMSALQEQLRDTQKNRARMDAEDEEIRSRIGIKDALVGDLIAGRSTLAEVTEQFTALDASRPEYIIVLRRVYPAPTDRESMARNVIAFALPRAAPSERAAVSSRLEADLQQMLSVSAH